MRVLPLLACGLLIAPLIVHAANVNAANPVTPFDAGTSVVKPVVSGDESQWLTPERAFHSTAQEPAIVRSYFPLLSIPATRQTLAPAVASRTGISEHGDRISRGRANDSHSQPQATDVGTSMGKQDVSLPRNQATEPNDTDGTRANRPFPGLEKLGESPPLAIENLPRLMLMTLLVLGTCLGTLLLGRRWLMRSGLVGKSQRTARLQIVASLSVAPRSYLHIVRFDDREVLVGVDSRGLQQMQIVPPSFDAVLQSSSTQETRATKLDDTADATASQTVRRLFTAA